MSENVCPQCGGPISAGALECKYCGEKLPQQAVNKQTSGNMNQGQPTIIVQQPVVQPMVQPVVQQPYVTGINPSWPIKSKIVAGLLALCNLRRPPVSDALTSGRSAP